MSSVNGITEICFIFILQYAYVAVSDPIFMMRYPKKPSANGENERVTVAGQPMGQGLDFSAANYSLNTLNSDDGWNYTSWFS